MIGARLGKWIIDREIGQGGMGHVYLAHAAPELDSPSGQAAVKVLSAALAQHPVFLSRFQREIEILRKLDHPNIVRLLEWGTHQEMPYFVMEYVDGRNFADLVLEAGRLPWKDVLDMALQVCPALKHAHDRGIIHRDLKPSNLLRTSAGLVKLTDFGIAQVFADTHLTATGAVVGTVEYVSPEQAAGKQATKRSDLYSLGVVMYALLTGRPPFTGAGPVDILHKHRFGQFDRPQRLVPELPHDLDEVVCHLLEKDPAMRPADAGILGRRLDSIARKLERKAGLTDPVGRDDPTLTGEAEPEPEAAAIPERGPGPATLMSRLMRQELERQNRGGPVNRLLNRPYVLIPLFLLTIGLIVWAFWPPSAESMYQRIAGLMASRNADDWQKAEELMDQLDQRHPDHAHKEDLRQFRERLADAEKLRQAQRLAERQAPASEAQWFYLQGVRLHQQGKTESARRLWQQLVVGFGDVPEEEPWVRLARRELREPGEHAVAAEHRWDAVERALRRARELRDAGKLDEARPIWQSLEDLYRDDPSAAAIRDQLKQDRGQ